MFSKGQLCYLGHFQRRLQYHVRFFYISNFFPWYMPPLEHKLIRNSPAPLLTQLCVLDLTAAVYDSIRMQLFT